MYVLRRMLEEINNAAAELEDYTVPERQYVTTGGAVYDCEQVTVSANQITIGLAGDNGSGGAMVNCDSGWNVQLELAIVRSASEAPTGRRGDGAPTVECIERDAELSSSDVAMLTRAVGAVAGPNWEQFGVVPASIQLGEVQGGLLAAVLNVTLNIWSFEPPPPP